MRRPHAASVGQAPRQVGGLAFGTHDGPASLASQPRRPTHQNSALPAASRHFQRCGSPKLWLWTKKPPCRAPPAGNELLQPCACTGTAAWVHYSCLVTWLDRRVGQQANLLLEGAVVRGQDIWQALCTCEICKVQLHGEIAVKWGSAGRDASVCRWRRCATQHVSIAPPWRADGVTTTGQPQLERMSKRPCPPRLSCSCPTPNPPLNKCTDRHAAQACNMRRHAHTHACVHVRMCLHPTSRPTEQPPPARGLPRRRPPRAARLRPGKGAVDRRAPGGGAGAAGAEAAGGGAGGCAAAAAAAG